MFTHISLFQLKPEAKAAAAEIVRFLRDLPAQVPGTVRNEAWAAAVLPPPDFPAGAAPADGGPAFFDIIQRISFESREAAAAYPLSQGHMALVERYGEKIAAVAAIDYEEG